MKFQHQLLMVFAIFRGKSKASRQPTFLQDIEHFIPSFYHIRPERVSVGKHKKAQLSDKDKFNSRNILHVVF